LPLCLPDFASSPYQSVSTFAGNTNLISPELLVRDGLLDRNDLGDAILTEERPAEATITRNKQGLLRRAWERFRGGVCPTLRAELAAFCAAEGTWLDDFSLFFALKKKHGPAGWHTWDPHLVERQPAALNQARSELASEIDYLQFNQFLFYRQWTALKAHAHQRGVRLIGDIPIYVASDSADVWANPQFFLLDANRRPTFVGGVPPDYFATTGQLWGSPLYDWKELKRANYSWWIARLRKAFEQVDLIRLDHFRGLEAFWRIPAGDPTAEFGSWQPGPGADLLETIRAAFGQLAIIAEDLGVITPEVDALRQAFHLPGMKVLQFAFAGAQEDRFLPHHHEQNTVVYTGTHDNDTAIGWYASMTEADHDFFRRYVPNADQDPARALVREAWRSPADLAIAPLQDVLGLGAEARMNLPGTATGNWKWRVSAEDLQPGALDYLGEFTETYQRMHRD
ncbi:MAG TPA: 4-alpha-glucanotransferase, partial [Pirellulales bacterium]|nr:4-alpha-glucanotransferase [Pirellulales bacterium]